MNRPLLKITLTRVDLAREMISVAGIVAIFLLIILTFQNYRIMWQFTTMLRAAGWFRE